MLSRSLTKEAEEQYNKLFSRHDVFLSYSLEPAQASRNIFDFNAIREMYVEVRENKSGTRGNTSGISVVVKSIFFT
jgi:hypothetical protein